MRGGARQLAVLCGAVVGVAVLLAVLSWWRTKWASCPFLTPQNLEGILRQSSTNLVLGAGMTFVILAGGIDLSVGSVMGLGTVLIAVVLERKLPVPIALLVGLAGTGACGLLNGLCAVKGGVPPFIVTLGMLLAAQSAAYFVAHGDTLAPGVTSGSSWLLPLLLPALVLALSWVALARTRFGRGVYAVGGNREAARLSGLPVDRIGIATFVLAGLASGVASAIYWSRTGTGSCLVGQGQELDAIAAVVVGGTSISGGEGHIAGTLLGALLMSELRNGLVILEFSEEWQKLVIGVVIVAAVFIDRVRARRAGAAA
jgi:ribose transport system permease protein